MASTEWKSILSELELQMTKATFNTWLKDATLIKAPTAEGEAGVIGVRNDYALEWVSSRLNETIGRTASGIYRFPCQFAYAVKELPQTTRSPQSEKVYDPASEIEMMPGFPLTDDWVRMPKVFFGNVIPLGSGGAVKLVGVVAEQTLGARRAGGVWGREWWEGLTHRIVATACGISYPNGPKKAVAESCIQGWIKWEERPNGYALALRFEGEPMCPNPYPNA